MIKNVKKRKKNIKIGLICVLLGMMLTFFNTSLSYADESVVFNTSNMAEGNIKIISQGNTLIFESFPKQEDFNYVILSLCGEDGECYLDDDVYSTVFPIIYPIIGISDGTYYIEIFHSSQENGVYRGMIAGKGGIKINIQNGIVSYVDSAVLENNKKIYENNLSSEEALKYYLKPSKGVESDNKKIIQLAKSIINESDNDYEKLRKVHDWVCNNVWYDYDAYYSGDYGDTNALAVLQSKRSVCQGYANLTAALLRALGIPTKVVSGYALGLSTNGQWTDELITGDKTNHAWNEAYVNDRWVILDTTWDSDNEYIDGSFSENTGLEGHKYFGPTLQLFSYDHKIVDNEPYQEYLKEYQEYLEKSEYYFEKSEYPKGIEYMRKVRDSLPSYIVLYENGEINKSRKLSSIIDDVLIDASSEVKKKLQITYSSEDSSIATVNKKGLISAKGCGRTEIIVEFFVETFGGGEGTEKYIDVVVEKPSLELTKYVKKMKVGQSTIFRVDDYGIKKIKWTSSDPSIATVSNTGKVKAKKVGTVYITASGGGCKDKVKLKIVKK